MEESINNQQVSRNEKGLTIDKLKAIIGENDLTDEQAEELIMSIKILVDILIDYQHQDEPIETRNIKEAA